MRSRRLARRRAVGLGGACALAVHAAGLAALLFTVRHQQGVPELEMVDVAPIDEATAREVLEALGPIPEEPERLQPDGQQVVRLPPSADNTPPTRATNLIAEDDANTEREQQRTGVFGGPVQRPAASGTRSKTADGERRAEIVREEVAPVAPRRLPAPVPAPEAPAAREAELAPPASTKPAPAIAPPAETAAAPPATGPVVTVGIGGGTDDLLPNVPEGTDTALRARRNALAGYFNQVRDKVRQKWRPSDVYRRVDPSGALLRVSTQGVPETTPGDDSLPGTSRYTQLEVKLRSDGTLERANIRGRSGVPSLDEEALSAFEGAQPFPAPPRESLDTSGALVFRFGFYLDLALAGFMSALKTAVWREWHPSKAFRNFGDRDRVTVVRLLLTFDGIVAHAAIESSSGLDVLDTNAIHAFKRGMRLPSPPAALGEVAGLVPVRIAFLHSVRGEHEVRIVRDPHL